VLKEEVESSYQQDIIMELKSEKIEDMQGNLDLIIQRVKHIMREKGMQG
jgi:hypothetical protein